MFTRSATLHGVALVMVSSFDGAQTCAVDADASLPSRGPWHVPLTSLIASILVMTVAIVLLARISSAEQVPHAPIVIDGDDDFTTENGVATGNGSAENPYIIDGVVIAIATGTGVKVTNTSAWFVLSNMSVLGSYVQGSLGFDFTDVRHVRMERVDVIGVDMGILGFKVRDITIQWCHVTRGQNAPWNVDDGINIRGIDRVEIQDVMIDNLTGRAIQIHGIDLERGDIVIKNTHISDCEDGIYTGFYCGTQKISHCWIERIENNAIWSSLQSVECEILHNIITDVGYGLTGDSSKMILAHNSMRCCGIGIQVSLREGVVEDNTISDSRCGIWYGGMEPFAGSVRKNLIANCTTGIILGSPHDLKNPPAYRTLIEDNIVRECVAGTLMNPFDVPGLPAYYALRGNRFTSCSDVGIELVWTSAISVADCIITDTPIGIRLNKVTDCNISRSVIEGLTCGIWATQSTGVNISYNTIRGASGWGISATEDCDLYVHHNNFIRNNLDPATSTYRGPQVWDSTYGNYHDGSEGNYWSDFTTRYPYARAFGRVWDVPYVLAGGAGIVDRYPLTLLVDWLPPHADAGANMTVPQGTNVTLDGSASADDNGITRSAWSFMCGGEAVALSGLLSSFTFHVPGVYTVLLTVWDAWGNNGSDTITVTVLDTEPPSTNAGPDLTVRMGERFALDASASRDNVGIVRFKWTVDPAGLDISLEGAIVELTLDEPGIYVVVLTVVDAAGNLGTDEVLVRVLDTLLPVADAGPDVDVGQGVTVALDGSASTDNVGIDRLWWSFVYRGEVIALDGAVVAFLFEVPGIYEVTLRASDLDGNIGSDDLTVTVHDTEPPVADAGPDLVVGQGPLSVSGLRSRDNVGIVRYEWTAVQGALSWSLEGVTVTLDMADVGSCIVTLRVWDAEGNTGEDGARIVVQDTTAPVVNAGPDLVIDMGAQVALDGSASWDNVLIVSYLWTVIVVGEELSWDGVRVLYTFEGPGTYQVVLAAHDAAGNTGKDVLTVFVMDTVPPVARAGKDIVVVEGARVTLDGSMCEDNVGVTSWEWRFVYEDAIRVLEGSTPTFEFKAAGDYTIELEVRDIAGNVAHDDLMVRVLPLMVRWRLGPFSETGGPVVEDVLLTVELNGTYRQGTTDEDGWLELIVSRFDLISPAKVSARKEGWEPLDFTIRLDEDGEPLDTVPPMVRALDISVKSYLPLGLLVLLLVAAVVLIASVHLYRMKGTRT